LDTEFSVSWTRQEVNGKEYLVREEPNALINMVEAKTSSQGFRMNNKSKEVLGFSFVIGGKLMYVRPDLSVGTGYAIKEDPDDNSRVVAKDIGTKQMLSVAKAGVITVVSMSVDEKSKLKEFFTKIWTPEMADEITKNV
jgi:hypothetical protein